MSYWIEDSRGKWLGDFTGAYFDQLAELGGSVKKFTDAGYANGQLVEAMVAQIMAKKRARWVEKDFLKVLDHSVPPIMILG